MDSTSTEQILRRSRLFDKKRRMDRHRGICSGPPVGASAHMFTAAHATSVLLLVIVGGATITNFFFGKRSWCKHVCPSARWLSQTSALSFVELGSNSNVCSSQCQTHDCVKDKNCPMGLHPSAQHRAKTAFCASHASKGANTSGAHQCPPSWNELLAREKWDVAGLFLPYF